MRSMRRAIPSVTLAGDPTQHDGARSRMIPLPNGQALVFAVPRPGDTDTGEDSAESGNGHEPSPVRATGHAANPSARSTCPRTVLVSRPNSIERAEATCRELATPIGGHRPGRAVPHLRALRSRSTGWRESGP